MAGLQSKKEKSTGVGKESNKNRVNEGKQGLQGLCQESRKNNICKRKGRESGWVGQWEGGREGMKYRSRVVRAVMGRKGGNYGDNLGR